MIEPNVVFGPGVNDRGQRRRSAPSATSKVRRFRSGAIIGPFARLRPGARSAKARTSAISWRSRPADVEEGAKINHLTYIGDARVGAKTNIGAGTITCNYDGVNKHLTDIGKNAFIGSNSALVAPVKIGDGAYVALGQRHHRGRAGGCAGVRPRPAGQQAGQGARRSGRSRRAKRPSSSDAWSAIRDQLAANELLGPRVSLRSP